MLSVDVDDMAYHLGRPLLRPLDISGVPLPRITDKLNEGLANLGHPATPESEAVVFYLLNHTMAIVRALVGDSGFLGKYGPAVDLYFERGHSRALRMFYYLLLICTRESRHLNSCHFSSTIGDNYGLAISDFHGSIKGAGSSTAINSLKHHAPDTTLGAFTQYLEDSFFNGKYLFGFGGKSWGAVARVLNQFVHGDISAEIMLDTGFTLAHNNGPIFNKGMLYTGYSGELITILDVQRSGQIPQLLNDHVNGVISLSRIESLHVQLWKDLSSLIGGEFLEHLDWDKVEALGSVGQYGHFKGLDGKQVGGAFMYYVLPGLGVKKIKRKPPKWV